jgi:hypothetical protein
VLQTFFFFLVWYLFFILAFGLGFYIMLHKVFEDRLVFDVFRLGYRYENEKWLNCTRNETVASFVKQLL